MSSRVQRRLRPGPDEETCSTAGSRPSRLSHYAVFHKAVQLNLSFPLSPSLLCFCRAPPSTLLPPPPAFPSLLAAASSSLGPPFPQPHPPCLRQHRISLLVFTQLPASSSLVPLERFPVTNTLCERYDLRRKDWGGGGGVYVAAMIFERREKKSE